MRRRLRLSRRLHPLPSAVDIQTTRQVIILIGRTFILGLFQSSKNNNLDRTSSKSRLDSFSNLSISGEKLGRFGTSSGGGGESIRPFKRPGF